ncbi:fibronectin type III domain-containing protein [Kineosporia sp. J2-2]|uniref:Fibronectin type III domain-containing protein n=1 Tax=Kineosporia corallincola TaxID=2835133 RepID=A0ABS5TKA7_9ACTN|nr:fibronectin type III domain-containing protein [Kineosporia corallincola]MBT0771516.1 fibronectin type III domain-containing protein [Kineosporia corallincola]
MVACVAVFALVLGAGLIGAQATGAVVRLQDGGAWLANVAQGSVTWVNGYAGSAGKTVPVGSLSSPFTVEQRADGAYAVDADGNATLIDGAQLKASDAPHRLSSGVDIVANDVATWLVDTSRGQVQRLDPDTLATLGEAVAVEGVTQAVVDDEGYLWAAVPSDGVVIRLWNTESGRTEVGRPGENITVAADEQGEHVIAVNATAGATFSLHGDDAARSFPAFATGSGASGNQVPQVDVDNDGRLLIGLGDQAVVVPPDGEGRSVTLPTGTQVDQVDIVSGVGYVTDRESGNLVRVDLGTAAGATVPNVGGDDLTDVVAHGNLLYLNDSGGNQVKVVKPDGVIVPIEKYRPGQDPTQRTTPVTATTTRPTTPDQPPASSQPRNESSDEPRDEASGEPTRGPRRNQGTPVTARPTTRPEDPEPERSPTPTQAPTTSEEPDEPEAPEAPAVTGLTADDGQALLEWSAAADRGSAVTGYQILVDNETVQEVGADRRSYTLTGLENGQKYGVRVRALSEAGQGDLSRISYVTPSADLPGAPQNVAAEALDGKIAVTWAAADDGPRSQVQGYTVTVRAVGGGATTADATGLQTTVGDLTNGTSYTVEVSARSTGGTGEAASPADGAVGSAGNPAVPSGTPGKVTFGTTTNGDTKATVTWTAADAAGSAITGYELKAGTAAAKNVGTVTSYSVTGLTNDVKTTVQVRAINKNGSGDWVSTTVAPVTPRKQMYQCQSTEVSDIYMINNDTDCTSGVNRWKTAVAVFEAPKTQQTGTVQWTRCDHTEDRGIIRRQMKACPSGWNANNVAFWAWTSAHTGATQIVEWHYPNGGYYYAAAGKSAPPGFTKTGVSFWV